MNHKKLPGRIPALRATAPHEGAAKISQQLAQDFRSNLDLAVKTASIGSVLLRRRLRASPATPPQLDSGRAADFGSE